MTQNSKIFGNGSGRHGIWDVFMFQFLPYIRVCKLNWSKDSNLDDFKVTTINISSVEASSACFQIQNFNPFLKNVTALLVPAPKILKFEIFNLLRYTLYLCKCRTRSFKVVIRRHRNRLHPNRVSSRLETIFHGKCQGFPSWKCQRDTDGNIWSDNWVCSGMMPRFSYRLVVRGGTVSKWSKES